MANLSINGLEAMQMDVASWASVPQEMILSDVILPAAEYLKNVMAEAAASLMNVVSGSLSGSIEILRKGVSTYGASALVGPNQKRHPHSTQGKRKPRAQGGGGGHYGGTNAEVAYILEYGSTRIPARHWMEFALREAEERIYQIMEDAFAALLELLQAAA